MTSFNAYPQYIVQRKSKYITSQNAKYDNIGIEFF